MVDIEEEEDNDEVDGNDVDDDNEVMEMTRGGDNDDTPCWW